MSIKVDTGENSVNVEFGNGVELTLNIAGGEYNGIGDAKLDGVTFLVPGRGSKPYFVTPEGVTYQTLLYKGVREDRSKRVIELDAVGYVAPVQQDLDMFLFPRVASGSGKVHDTLEITLEPRSQELNGETYTGFSISYAFKSSSRSINWLLESISIAPGGSLQNTSVMAQHMTSNICALEENVTIDSTYSSDEDYNVICIQAPCRGGGSQLYDLVQGSGIAVVDLFEKPDTLKSLIATQPGEDYVTVADFHYQALSKEFTTQPRIILAAKEKSGSRAERLNRWTAWFDYTTKLWQDALGIRHTETLPVIAFDGTGGGGIDPGTTYAELLTDWAGRMDWLNEQGIRGIILHTPEWLGAANSTPVIFGGNNCTPSRYRLSDFLGGDAGLKKFCDTAHEHSIKVYFWMSGHLWAESPAWKEHPEWVTRNVGGLIWDGHYHTIHGMSFIHGAREWVANDLKATREATGADGVWFDSFTNLSAGTINYQSPEREPNAPGVFNFLGDLSKMGYEIMIECMSQLGVSSWGNLKPESLQGQEELLYNTCLRTYLRDWHSDPSYTGAYYFRTLAARAPYSMWIAEYKGKPAPFPPVLPDWYTPLNQAYAKVESRMKSRIVLEDGQGVLWTDENKSPSALFAFKDGSYTFENGAIDLMTDEKIDAGSAKIIEGHIYSL